MRTGCIRAVIAILLAGCFFQAVCQTDDSSLYNRLFSQSVDQPIAPLTDQEMQVLKAIAADCQSATNALPRVPVFDALMESIETGQDNSEQVQQELKDRQDQAHRILLLHIDRLRAALGDARFEALTKSLRTEDASKPKAAKRK